MWMNSYSRSGSIGKWDFCRQKQFGLCFIYSTKNLNIMRHETREKNYFIFNFRKWLWIEHDLQVRVRKKNRWLWWLTLVWLDNKNSFPDFLGYIVIEVFPLRYKDSKSFWWTSIINVLPKNNRWRFNNALKIKKMGIF